MSNLSILIHKDSSAEFPYTVHDHGFQVGEFTTLDEARQFIMELYDYPEDPTRFIFHTPETGFNDANNAEKSLDLIAINVCEESRIVESIRTMLKEKSPRHHEEIIEKTARKLNLSPLLIECILILHSGLEGEFWYLHPFIYL